MVIDANAGLKLQKAMLKSADILLENGLADWKLKLNNKRSALAETYYGSKTIMFSKHFVLVADEDQFIGVTLHEVTHALLGRGHGHNKQFKELCEKISPNADYARRSVDVPIRKYLLECPKCGYSGSTNVNKERYCGMCWKNDKEAVLFTRKENILEVKVW